MPDGQKEIRGSAEPSFNNMTDELSFTSEQPINKELPESSETEECDVPPEVPEKEAPSEPSVSTFPTKEAATSPMNIKEQDEISNLNNNSK